MAIQLQLRKGTASENDAFTGVVGEITADTTSKTIRVHDGINAGGFTLVAKDASGNFAGNVITATSFSGDGSALTGISAGATVVTKSDDVSYNVVFTNETSGTQGNAYINASKLYFNPSTGTLNSTTFNSLSDIKFKENIISINNPRDKVNKLRGVNYNWKDNGNFAMGVIAQEVEEVLPEVVSTDCNGNKSVSYSNMVGLLIEAIKDQQQQIDELKKLINKSYNG
jgi:hypothetical protein